MSPGSSTAVDSILYGDHARAKSLLATVEKQAKSVRIGSRQRRVLELLRTAKPAVSQAGATRDYVSINDIVVISDRKPDGTIKWAFNGTSQAEQAMRRMMQLGLVERDQSRRQTYYRITDDGLAVLD